VRVLRGVHAVPTAGGVATGIDGIMSAAGTENIYDLQGRKVKVAEQGSKLRKGVYIVNGQKQVR